MGQMFSGQGLTVPNSALVAPSGQPSFVGAPSQVLSRANAALPSTSQMLGSDVLHPQFNQDSVANLPKIGKPGYQQAAAAGAALPGEQNALSPALTKGGKLATLLMNGLQGALAGRAASEQAVIQSGGRRSAGAGTGFEAGYTLPFVRAQQGQGVRRGEAETQLAEQGLQPVDVGGVSVPQAVAPKFLSPYLGYQGKTQAAQIGATGRTQAAQIGAGAREQAAQTEAGARVKAAELNLGPMANVPQDLQQQFGLPPQLPLRMLNQAEGAANRPLTTVYGENDAYTVNRETGEKKALGVGNRAAGAAGARYVVVQDEQTGMPKYMKAAQAASEGASAGATNLNKPFQFKARMDDMTRVVGAMNSALPALDQNDVQRGLMARAFQQAEHDGPGALSAIINSELFTQMTPQSQDFVVNNISGRENLMAAAQMLSSSGLSDARVRAVLNAWPTVSDTSDLAKKKMVQVNGMLGNLREMMPQANFIGDNAPPKRSAANPPKGTQRFTDNGVSYNIPAAMVAEFKKDHPNAR